MISNKTTATLFFITLNMQRAASTAPNSTKKPRSSIKSIFTKIQKRPSGTRRAVPTLQDATDTVRDVEAIGEGIEMMGFLLEQPTLQINGQFEGLIEQGEYGKIFEIGKDMNDEEFLMQLCPVIETLDQYKGIIDHLKRRKMVASFYVFGDIEVVRGAIIESGVYAGCSYADSGALETALPLALEKDCHDRVIKLLDVRREITAEEDKRPKQFGWQPSFKWFVSSFLENLAPWKDGMALRRFLFLCGDELRNKYPDILDIFSRWLVHLLSDRLYLPKAEIFLDDLIGQPLLLTPVIFATKFLYHGHGTDGFRSAFIKYGWREAIQEGLKAEYHGGGKKLWRAMEKEKPNQFHGEFPDTEEARTAVSMHFPTKRQKEEQWIKKNAVMLCAMIKRESISNLLPDVLWSIIFEYAVLLVATWNLTIPSE